jgi:hypothetical protein
VDARRIAGLAGLAALGAAGWIAAAQHPPPLGLDFEGGSMLVYQVDDATTRAKLHAVVASDLADADVREGAWGVEIHAHDESRADAIVQRIAVLDDLQPTMRSDIRSAYPPGTLGILSGVAALALAALGGWSFWRHRQAAAALVLGAPVTGVCAFAVFGSIHGTLQMASLAGLFSGALLMTACTLALLEAHRRDGRKLVAGAVACGLHAVFGGLALGPALYGHGPVRGLATAALCSLPGSAVVTALAALAGGAESSRST